MTEKELIEEGFEKITVPNSESDNGYDYYFYELGICDHITLYSTDSIDVKDDNWTLECWEIYGLKIANKDTFQQFKELMTNIICE